MIEKLFLCDCCGHGIVVSRDEDEVNISIWTRSASHPRWYDLSHTWRRLKDAWSVYRKGYIEGELILTAKTAKLLGEELCRDTTS